jgi:hypothetical protein
MHNGDRDAVGSGAAAMPQTAPVLLPPQPIVPSAIGGVAVLGVMGALAAAFVMFGDRLGPASNSSQSSGGKPAVIALAADQAPGAFKILPASFQNAPARVIAQLNMPEAEKRRLAEKLADGAVRLAAVTLWDTVDEDGDVVEVSAATFSQTLTIMHKPVTFFLPLQPGGTVSIRAVRDGGGGGVTLGVSTVIGPVPLPSLAPGQIVEIPAL